jgi:uncharacterized protein YjbJ (UPF0337 family)
MNHYGKGSFDAVVKKLFTGEFWSSQIPRSTVPSCPGTLRSRRRYSRVGSYSGLAACQHQPEKIAKEAVMDWNRVEGNWKQVKGQVKEKWGKLTDDDLTAINGKREQLEGKIQERYGVAQDQARKDVDDWYARQSW